MPYNIQGDALYFDDRRLGPTSALYVDKNELRFMTDETKAKGIIRLTLPERIDFLFVAGDKVVGCESKKPMDLVSSYAQGRLSRQLRTIGEVCDHTLLVLRGGADIHYLRGLVDMEQTRMKNKFNPHSMFVDLFVRYPMLGIQVVGVPDLDDDIPFWLNLYRMALMHPEQDIRALARTDQRPSRRYLDEKGGYLRHIPGVGKVTAAKLYKAFGSTKAALNAPRKKWLDLKFSKKLVDKRDEVLK